MRNILHCINKTYTYIKKHNIVDFYAPQVLIKYNVLQQSSP